MRLLLLLIFPLLFTGCFSYFPLNLSEDEYNELTFEQKIKAKEYQAKLDNERAIERLKNQREREKHEYALALKEQENLKYLYQNSNEILHVNMYGGSIKYLKDGYHINPFTLRLYEVKKIPVYSSYNRIHHHIWVSFQEEGLYIGITPKDSYEHLSQYTSRSHNLYDEGYYKPTIIARSQKWYQDRTYLISLQHQYDAHNIKVKLYLDEGNKRRYRY